MPNRFNGNEPDNIRNTDDEDTMLLPNGLDSFPSSEPKRELPPLRKNINRPNSQNNGGQSYQQTPPHFPQSGQPPQFPQSAPPQQQYNYNEQRYYDYNYQAPQNYNGGYNPPPPPPSAPSAPPQQPAPRQQYIPPQHKTPKKKKRKHKSLVGKIIWRILRIFLILFLLIFGIYSCTSISLIRKMNYEDTSNLTHYASSAGHEHVRSFLVIGTDGRTKDDRGRSDSMILVSLNSKTNEIIMTSFMRDCYVDIPDNGWDKLNAAYSYGGPELLIQTIENNFDVRIDDYVTIDFASFVSVVDSVGGVDIEVSNEEAEEINVILMAELNGLMGDDRMADLLNSGGKLHLNGKQALAYSRIRHVGNSDFERTERQRRVLSLIIAKLKSFKPSIFKNLASDVIPDISTNMTTMRAYLLSLRLPFAARYNIKQIQIPAEGTYYGDDVDVGSVLQVDRDANMKIIESEVFAK
ncbi:MAG: LCP family protein [Ruminococcus sp.]|uniref:LCP family protein n=1 Tax=Ruminococcus sp. TaxID=41978 RepID=UPI0025EB6D0B|nr:LCP family protein [Ruminococcus sp.]MCR5599732.1 LCP family protein [Ruminococcus sp.]